MGLGRVGSDTGVGESVQSTINLNFMSEGSEIAWVS